MDHPTHLHRSRATCLFVASLLASGCAHPRAAAPGPHQAGQVYEEEGEASWYGSHGDGLVGKPTASGERYDPARLTCAHRTLPLGSLVEVQNLANGKKAILRVNDRGPFIHGRILDASRSGAQSLGFVSQGVARVRLRCVNAHGTALPLDPDTNRQNPYTIQVAALSDPANIERLSAALRDAYGDVSLQDAPSRYGAGLKRVRVGRFTSLAAAEQTAKALSKRFQSWGLDPFITRVQ